MVRKYSKIITNIAVLISFFFSILHCTTQHISTTPQKLPEQNILIPEFEREGFIDVNTYRVIIIVPSGTLYDESALIQKGRERAYVSLKNYLMSQQKHFDARIHNYLTSTIASHGTLTHRGSDHSARACYFFDIKKTGLKLEIDALGR